MIETHQAISQINLLGRIVQNLVGDVEDGLEVSREPKVTSTESTGTEESDVGDVKLGIATLLTLDAEPNDPKALSASSSVVASSDLSLPSPLSLSFLTSTPCGLATGRSSSVTSELASLLPCLQFL